MREEKKKVYIYVYIHIYLLYIYIYIHISIIYIYMNKVRKGVNKIVWEKVKERDKREWEKEKTVQKRCKPHNTCTNPSNHGCSTIRVRTVILVISPTRRTIKSTFNEEIYTSLVFFSGERKKTLVFFALIFSSSLSHVRFSCHCFILPTPERSILPKSKKKKRSTFPSPHKISSNTCGDLVRKISFPSIKAKRKIV